MSHLVAPSMLSADFTRLEQDILMINQSEADWFHLHVMDGVFVPSISFGMVLNPHTSVALLEDIITELDVVLLMSVNPGFGGQRFIEQTFRKIENLKQIIITTGSQALIEVDGGVTLENKASLLSAGADVLVAGNTVFKSKNPAETIHLLKI